MIYGFCMGGAVGLAMACDLRFAAEGSKFGIPAARLSIIYPAEAIAQLVDLVGPAYAKDILFSARIAGRPRGARHRPHPAPGAGGRSADDDRRLPQAARRQRAALAARLQADDPVLPGRLHRRESRPPARRRRARRPRATTTGRARRPSSRSDGRSSTVADARRAVRVPQLDAADAHRRQRDLGRDRRARARARAPGPRRRVPPDPHPHRIPHARPVALQRRRGRLARRPPTSWSASISTGFSGHADDGRQGARARASSCASRGSSPTSSGTSEGWCARCSASRRAGSGATPTAPIASWCPAATRHPWPTRSTACPPSDWPWCPSRSIWPSGDAASRPSSRRPSGPPTVLAVARMYPRKRLDDLLRAAAVLRERIPDVRVRIVGAGPESARLHALHAALGLGETVTFLGEVSRQELAVEYVRAHCFCLPTVQEGFGLVFAEAMAAGLAVVACRAAAVPEIVEDRRTGLLVNPRQPRGAGDGAGDFADERRSAGDAGSGRRRQGGGARPRAGRASIRPGRDGMSAQASTTRRFAFSAGHRYHVERRGRPSATSRHSAASPSRMATTTRWT